MKPDATTVFSFPMQSPIGAVHTADMTAIQQLDMWLMYQRHWCEHKPSVTINVKADEWLEVGAFVYKHFDEMSGVSFLPFNEHTHTNRLHIKSVLKTSSTTWLISHLLK